MIHKIDIRKFGIFKNFDWNSHLNTNTFQALNLMYGRNYSGKTTFSRIFQSLETQKLHEDFRDANFELTLSDNRKINTENLSTNDLVVRVFNSDFVKNNLSYLYDSQGSIQTFAILGEKNVEIESQIQELNQKLKNLEFDLIQKREIATQKQRLYQSEHEQIEDLLRNKAKEIKNNAKLFNSGTYIIRNIKADILSLKPHFLLNYEDKELRISLLKEDAKTTIPLLTVKKPNFESYLASTIQLLNKKIEPTQAITDLLHDTLLQEWVRQGIDKHQDRQTCGFCGADLSPDWKIKLDAHFSKASQDLRLEIQNQIHKLENAKKGINEFLKLDKTNFYSTYHHTFDLLYKLWQACIEIYSDNIDYLINELVEREKDIFTPRPFNPSNIADNSVEIMELLRKFNALIYDTNQKTQTLSKDQEKAYHDLRLSEVAFFVQSINYYEKLAQIEKLEQEANKAQIDADNYTKVIRLVSEEIRELESQIKDESKGADLVNFYLNTYFGHTELELVATGESPNLRFQILRNGAEAKNLSQGECSLIAFCYYVAKIENELQNANQNLTLYIDDPITSLDNNHVLLMFKFIESVILQPKKYHQLFISTHNSDFLKHLQSLPENLNPFLIERKTAGACIRSMEVLEARI